MTLHSRSAAPLVAVLAIVFPTRAGLAQTAGALSARATVLPSLTVAGTDLAFGNVARTSVKTVLAKNGGRFTVTGPGSTPITIRFVSVPAALGANLLLTGWTGLHGPSNGTGAATAFVPATGLTLTVTLSPSGAYHVWLGATLTAANAVPGTYSVPIRFDVAYQ